MNKVNFAVPNGADVYFLIDLVYTFVVGWHWAWWLREHNDMTETILMSQRSK